MILPKFLQEAAGPMDLPESALTGTIIGCAMKVHRVLGPGFLESVYQNALAYEVRRAGLDVQLEFSLEVEYEGVVVGRFVADLVVGGAVIVENKAVQKLLPSHEVQLVNYLTATGIDIGLLLNFGGTSLEFKRKCRSYPLVPSTHDGFDGIDGIDPLEG